MTNSSTPAADSNVLIFSHEFKETVGIVLNGDSIQVGELKISYLHDQSCCESVYADFAVFDYYLKDLREMGIRKLEIKAVEDMGLVFFFYDASKYGDPNRIGVLVNCYNEQNGYYSDELQLEILQGSTKHTIDISQVVYNKIR